MGIDSSDRDGRNFNFGTTLDGVIGLRKICARSINELENLVLIDEKQ